MQCDRRLASSTASLRRSNVSISSNSHFETYYTRGHRGTDVEVLQMRMSMYAVWLQIDRLASDRVNDDNAACMAEVADFRTLFASVLKSPHNDQST